jgi:glycosyltransferase involved in cell wall biosynthesis
MILLIYIIRQVSKHEGLGLGFYESLQTGTPIITLDTPPHNEIIKDSINGWIIPCHHKKMTDNQDGLIESAYFNPQILADKIIEITNNKETLGNLFQKLINDYISRFDINLFINRFISSLN